MSVNFSSIPPLYFPNFELRSLTMKNALCFFIGLLLATMVCGCSAGRGETGLVAFKYKGPAQTVCVAGTFNGWSQSSHCLKFDGEKFNGSFPIAPGHYEYLFVLDSGRWEPDPEADFIQEDEFGTKNSILIVENR